MLSNYNHINKKLRIAIPKLLLILSIITSTYKVQAQYCSNTVTTNVNITPTATAQQTASYSSGRRAFNFSATAGCTYYFETCGLSTADTYLRLYSTGTGGTVLATGDDNCGLQSAITWTCGTTGTYSILMTNWSCAALTVSTALRYQLTGCTTPFNPCASITNIINCGSTISFTVASGTGAYNPPTTSCGFTTPGKENVYAFTPIVSGAYTISQTTSFGYIDYFFKQVSSGCNGTGWNCIDDLSGAMTSVPFSLTAGIQYYIMTDPESTTGGNVTFTINCPSAPLSNDNCLGATNISIPYNSGIVNTSSATDDIPSATSGCGFQGSNVWFKLTGTGNNIAASTCNPSTNYDTELRVYTGTCGSMVEVNCNDDDISCPNSGLHSSLSWCSTLGVEYYISAGYFYSGPGYGNFVLSVSQSTICGPLPIELVDFNANCFNANIELNWTTASENNNDYFTIEKSSDAVNFTKLSTVNGAGNSNEYLHYSFLDTEINHETVYYRLKQTDYDGKYSYSNLISSTCISNNRQNLFVYPNPSKGTFTIKGLETNSILTIRDPLGKTYKTEKIKNDSEEYNLTDLPKGIYYIYMISGTEIKSEKIILQ